MRVAALASGSSGNCIFVETAGARVLIDAGLPRREVAARLARVPRAPALESIDAVLITHAHADHASGAAGLGARGLALYASEDAAPAVRAEGVRPAAPGAALAIGDLTVRAVPVPHDAPGTVAWVLSAGGVTTAVVTDCGHVPAALREALAGVDLLVLEANHDRRLLAAGPYPAGLRRRIASRLGHLSNEQSAGLLRALGRAGPRALMLAHLSRVNNRPALARRACAAALARRGAPIEVAPAARPSPAITVSCASVRVDPIAAGSQLELFAAREGAFAS